MKLYAVVTIQEIEKISRHGNTYIGHDTRIPGIYTTLEKAKECVENNYGDIWETSYDLVVIEETETDYLYQTCRPNIGQWWYEWKGVRGMEGVGTKGYVACECPKRYQNIVGWGIG